MDSARLNWKIKHIFQSLLRFALKKFKDEDDQNYKAEIKNLIKMKEENYIIKIEEAFTHEGDQIIVTEYCEVEEIIKLKLFAVYLYP